MPKARLFLSAAALFAALACVPAQAGFLFWTASDGVYRSGTDGMGKTQIVSGDSSRGFSGVAADPASGFVYWAEDGTSDIWRSDSDGGDQTRLVDLGSFGSHGLDITPAHNRVVWSTDNNLLRDDLNPSTPQAFPVQGVVSGGTSSNGVAVASSGDPTKDQAYWTFGGNAIRQTSVLGGAVADVVTGLSGVFDLALDTVNGFVYWTEPGWVDPTTHLVTGRIAKADLGGLNSNVTTIVQGQNVAHSQGIALDVAHDQLYWINDNVTNAGSTIFTSSLAGGDVTRVLTTAPTSNADFLAVTPAAVPEPSSALLLAAAGLGVVGVRRLRRKPARD
jgi:hypothetical protein